MGKNDLCIICFWWGNWGGKFGAEYVNRLYRATARNLSPPHRFICFADKYNGDFEHGIEVVPLSKQEAAMRWNLTKMAAYRPNNGLTGRVIMLDLDVVIVGSIDEICSYDGQFATCEAAYRPGKIGGSIVGFPAGFGARLLWQPLSARYNAIANMTRGSERIYYHYCMGGGRMKIDFWQRMYPGQVLSYKVDCRNGLPEGARIVRFHGKPRPHEVGDEWVVQNWV